ncbi:MAG: YkgJ family cysteine cluster protein [Hyphomicrobiaceae bacterium]|nr:YkgJ family cysteine cluster protein [Hyphomicrobiaceae bacterium]
MSSTLQNSNKGTPNSAASPCLSCGACCVYSHEWPRFSTESDEELALIPEALVAENLSGMRCEENRCAALSGKIGEKVACTIYDVRPHVCRACEIGDDACEMARAHHGMPPIALQSP